MFWKQPIIICSPHQDNTLDVAFVGVNNNGYFIEKTVSGCTFDTLAHTYHVKHVRILLSEEDVYLTLLRFPNGGVVTRQRVIEQARIRIPETDVETYMDWKQVDGTTSGIGVQLFVVKHSVLQPLVNHASDAGIVIDAVEPPSLAMARMTRHIHEPFLFAYPHARPTMLVSVVEGKVLEVARIDEGEDVATAQRAFVSYVKKQWGVTLTAVASDAPNPILGLAAKQDFHGEDMEVLTIPHVASTKRSRPSLVLALIGLGTALVVVACALLIVKMVNNPHTPQGTGGGETVVVPPTQPVVQPLPLQRSALRVEVQNGTGTPGLAGQEKRALEELGYRDVTSANADLYDYDGVSVQGKTASIAAFVAADMEISHATATASQTLLDSALPIDAIVILGRE